MLREYLAKDAPLREGSVALYMAGVSALSVLVSLALGPKIGWNLSFALAALISVIFLYYASMRFALKRGWYHRIVPWINVTIEVSIPSVIFVIDLSMQSAEYALTAPPLVIWGSLVALSGLRTSRPLALAAGALAACEYLGLYFFVARPRLPQHALVTLGSEMVLTRAFLLFCAGIVTAIFAGHLTRKAEEALAAVRERDWMGKYLLHERIGVGGMAEVFRATYSPEGGFEKRVAVKRVLPAFAENEEFVRMFREEAELCSWLAHPNIVQVLDLGRHEDTYYLAMEFVDGVTLKRLIQSHPEGMPVAAVAWLALELSKALEYTHSFRYQGKALGLVHRDMNPPNILISAQGDVKLSDFGIARAGDRVSQTEVGTVRGKMSYLSPEQAEGKPFDGRADLFALGLTLHECLTGKQVYAVDPIAALHVVVNKPVPPMSSQRDDVPDALESLIASLVEKDPERRLSSAGKCAALLLSLPEEAAPFPNGQALLAKCVAKALITPARRSGIGLTAPPREPTVENAVTTVQPRPSKFVAPS